MAKKKPANYAIDLGKRPRHYALGYLSAGSDKAKQKSALSGCPVEWQDLVKSHIRTFRRGEYGRI